MTFTVDRRTSVSFLTVALLVLTAVATPAMAAGGSESPMLAAQNNTTTTPTPTPTPTSTSPSDSAGASNTTRSDAPTMASQVRVTPIRSDEPYRSITVGEKDAVFNTTGPAALFELSQPVEAVRITQAPAEARVLGDGRIVRVTYSNNASQGGQSSLYELELFFPDDSRKVVDLYARQTGVSVAASEYEHLAPYIKDVQADAEAEGYDPGDPEALMDYHDYLKDRADLVEGFLMERSIQFIMTIWMLAKNPIFWLVFIAALVLLAHYFRSKFGSFLEVVRDDPGRASRARRQLAQRFTESKQTAAEEALTDVDAIGNEAIIWEDAYNVRSPSQLANLAAFGLPRHVEDEDDGDGMYSVVRVGGVEEIDPETPRDSWLEPVLRDGRLPNARQALGQIKAVLEHMEAKHNMGFVYRDALDHTEHLIDQMDANDGRYDVPASPTRPGAGGSPGGAGTPAGGDD